MFFVAAIVTNGASSWSEELWASSRMLTGYEAKLASTQKLLFPLWKWMYKLPAVRWLWEPSGHNSRQTRCQEEKAGATAAINKRPPSAAPFSKICGIPHRRFLYSWRGQRGEESLLSHWVKPASADVSSSHSSSSSSSLKVPLATHPLKDEDAIDAC